MISLNEILAQRGRERSIHYSLDRILAALESAGSPHKNVKSLVIGGTNGKGTTALLISSALKEAGFRVATYLSPHLQSVTERFLLNLEPIQGDALEELALHYEDLGNRFYLSYFEFLTFLFFKWAEAQQTDFVVLEVGLGGRLDATNVTDPIACAITNISMDHQALLGSTPLDILKEKLGILNKEGLLFTGIKEEGLLKSVIQACDGLDSIYYLTKELNYQRESVTRDGQRVNLSGIPFELNSPTPGTLENAALAFLLMRLTFPKLSMACLQKAFAKVENPGRFEWVTPNVVLSGDHNPAGLDCLLTTLDWLNIRRPHILCAFSHDKPYREMYARLSGIAGKIVLTQTPHSQDLLSKDYFSMGPFEENPKHAVEAMLRTIPEGETLLITGSLYLVGEVRGLWYNS